MPPDGLYTYTQYVNRVLYPVPPGSSRGAVYVATRKRTEVLQRFTDPSQPGAQWKSYVAILKQNLQLPPEMLAAGNLQPTGLSSGTFRLLPSFLNCLTHLMEQDRKFSLCFRAFGEDLQQLELEMNAFCIGEHPLQQLGLASRSKRSTRQPSMMEQMLGAAPAQHSGSPPPMDGSDGAGDYRVHLKGKSCATWEKDGHGLPELFRGEDVLVARFGTEEAHEAQISTEDTGECIVSCVPNNRVIQFVVEELAKPQTVILRDPSYVWNIPGSGMQGGKLMMIDTGSTDALTIVINDRTETGNTRIVDIHRNGDMSRQSNGADVHLQRVLNSHLVEGDFMHAVLDTNYFIGVITAAEEKWQNDLHLRHTLRLKLEALISNAEQNWKSNFSQTLAQETPGGDSNGQQRASDGGHELFLSQVGAADRQESGSARQGSASGKVTHAHDSMHTVPMEVCAQKYGISSPLDHLCISMRNRNSPRKTVSKEESTYALSKHGHLVLPGIEYPRTIQGTPFTSTSTPASSVMDNTTATIPHHTAPKRAGHKPNNRRRRTRTHPDTHRTSGQHEHDHARTRDTQRRQVRASGFRTRQTRRKQYGANNQQTKFGFTSVKGNDLQEHVLPDARVTSVCSPVCFWLVSFYFPFWEGGFFWFW